MSDWIALGALVLSLIVTVATATCCISNKIGQVIAKLSVLGARLDMLDDSHADSLQKIEQNSHDIAEIRGRLG
jgi:hypothetical protein